MNRGSADFHLRYAFRALRDRLPLFLVCVLLVPAGAAIVSVLQTKQYTATATLLFRNPQFDQMLFGSAIAQSQVVDPTRQAATNVDLVSLPRVAALTAAQLHMTEQQVSSAVSESAVGQSDLVAIKATARTPASAAQLANTFASQFIAFRRNAERATLAAAELPLEGQIASLPPSVRDGALGQSLRSRLDELKVLASLQTGNAELAQPAEIPGGPSSPKPARNTAIGIFFGLLLGIALVVLAEALDRRLHDPDEVEHIFERPVLATVRASSALTDVDDALLPISEPEREAFQMLWANFRYFTLTRDIASVLITSADRDEGKSTVAWGLAATAANAGRRTLVIEADLRNPTFPRRFDVSASVGLTNVLIGDVALGDAIMRYRFPRSDSDPSEERTMGALFAGPTPPNPSDLLQSPRMAELVREAKSRYDLVVIDTPPAGVVSDAIPLMPLVDGVIVVSRLGKTLRDHAHRLRRQLDHLDAPMLGVVINSPYEAQPYAYGYLYGDGAADGYRASSPTAAQHTNGTRAQTVIDQPAPPRRGD